MMTAVKFGSRYFLIICLKSSPNFIYLVRDKIVRLVCCVFLCILLKIGEILKHPTHGKILRAWLLLFLTQLQVHFLDVEAGQRMVGV